MGKSAAPTPPNPKETSAAQTGTNLATAIANNTMGMMDQYTPYGSLTYQTIGGAPLADIQEVPGAPAATARPGVTMGTGFGIPGGRGEGRGGGLGGTGGVAAPAGPSTFKVGDQSFGTRAEAEAYRNKGAGGQVFTDPYTGMSYSIPRYQSTVKLSPAEQAILDQNTAARTNLAGLANERSAFLKDYMSNTGAVTDQIDAKLNDLAMKRLDPMLAQRRTDLETQLSNQGIKLGSAAYDRAMEGNLQGENDARNQLILNGRSQAMNEVNAPINQITALLSGSQVNNPNVAPVQPGQMPTTDNAGLINANYNQKLSVWQQNQAQKQALMGGLFGLAAGGLEGGYFH